VAGCKGNFGPLVAGPRGFGDVPSLTVAAFEKRLAICGEPLLDWVIEMFEKDPAKNDIGKDLSFGLLIWEGTG